MAFTLIVKGNKAFAIAALHKRGIKYYDIVQHERFEECIVIAQGDTSWETLAKWFCETTGRMTPFPLGSLLWYGPRMWVRKPASV